MTSPALTGCPHLLENIFSTSVAAMIGFTNVCVFPVLVFWGEIAAFRENFIVHSARTGKISEIFPNLFTVRSFAMVRDFPTCG